MKEKILGISLSVLGIAALVITLIGINSPASSGQVNMLLAGGVVGTIMFFTGIWLSGRTLSRRVVTGDSNAPAVAAGSAA